MAYIYIIHFDEPLHHARHYAGCTRSLKQRLVRHACGAGSNLCRVIMELGITWHLGAVMQCTTKEMRRVERTLKDLHNTPTYCEICNPDSPIRLPNTIPYPLAMIPFPTDSVSLLAGSPMLQNNDIKVRFSSPDEPKSLHLWIKGLMKKDKDALGFIPVAGEKGINLLHDKGQIAIVSNNGQDVGYSFFTITPDNHRLTIHQACIADEARLFGHGRALVQAVIDCREVQTILAKVRDDLAANHFWQAVGFTKVGSFNHQTSKRMINQYLLMKGQANEL